MNKETPPGAVTVGGNRLARATGAVTEFRHDSEGGGVRRDSGVPNTELGAGFSHILLMAFRAPHFHRGPHGNLQLFQAPRRPFTRRTEETREAVSKRLEFFVSLPHGRGQRDRAKNETAQHFNVDRRTIERDLVKATRTLKMATRQQNTALAWMADWALSVLEGREDKTLFQLADEYTQRRTAACRVPLTLS